MIIEIQDRQIKNLYIAAQKIEKEEGKSIPEMLLGLIYDALKRNDGHLFLEAIRIYYNVTLSRDLDMDWILEEEDEGEPVEIISLDKGKKSEKDD